MQHVLFFFSSRRRHTRFDCDWSSDVCSSDLAVAVAQPTRESHCFVVPLRTEEPIDVGAVLGKVGRTELPTAGELEDDRDQLDATVNADAQFFRLRRYLRGRKDQQEGESSRAKRHNASRVYSPDSTRLAPNWLSTSAMNFVTALGFLRKCTSAFGP